MKREKKPRADAVLKTLPADRQAAIVEYLRTHTIADTRAWLAADGLRTSVAALSLFLSWYQWRELHARNEASVDSLVEELRRKRPELSAEDLFEHGQQVFSLLAMQQENASDWARVQRLNLVRERTGIEARRVAVLERKAAQADAAEKVTQSELSPEEKLSRYKEIFGLS